MACLLPEQFAALEAVPRTTVGSGCSIVTDQNSPMFASIPCDPHTMMRLAEQKIGQSLSLDIYSLARNIASEIGSGTVAEKVAMALSTCGKAELGSLGESVAEVILHNNSCKFGRGTGCFYGQVHDGGDVTKHTSGRFTASTRDPSLQDIAVARLVLSGQMGKFRATDNFARGADDQWSPLSAKHGDRDAAIETGLAKITIEAASGDFWVGPICGVDPVKLQMFRRERNVVDRTARVVTLRQQFLENAGSPRLIGPDFNSPLLAGFVPWIGAAIGTYVAYKFWWRPRRHRLDK